MDLYLTAAGDLAADTKGDLASTEVPWRADMQQAYTRIMTEEGDFTVYPNFGASLEKLKGMPQTPSTAKVGEDLIKRALTNDNRFNDASIQVTGIPTSPTSIRFDVKMTSSSAREIKFSVEQTLSGTAA